ncbi:hypothetical protein D5039_00230 [Verminephrobacter aporrectodeae subsp. tuberculatae]|uniref:Dephospho-CoA kinase n=1 Tax=Verminephrobacter aporrectodeae subsp. tuberculatae TaxID=1110392 RepID=A0ABT3KMW9_9BURK|nr:hypothetical protein [Verminephrobacter aporrectodeae]MCW5319662.1 hypothetical protein [Verminephrobacter aporrectodeae subsp. tuberculatae]
MKTDDLLQAHLAAAANDQHVQSPAMSPGPHDPLVQWLILGHVQSPAMSPGPHLIALTGPAGCGKDTVARLLREHCGARTMAFADALRSEIAEAFSTDPIYLTHRATKEHPMGALALRRCLDSAFVDRLLAHHETIGQQLDLAVARSPRAIMQWWGTEYRRQQDPAYWVKIACANIMQLRQDPDVQTIVLTDLRFDNEAEMLRAMGARVWKIKRPGCGHAEPSHVSQVTGEQFAPDLTINNDGGILHLQQLVLDGLTEVSA